ncbi:hypothetical protein AQ505_06245 [Pedobacter sp. PACM 27299]|uniref:hypothetical protein n=1 Tax=Pedobacter sp. PACM 27299 TaxID=1727164 RepID=UPI000706298F|nr:hypothetical protein [Pedobacter sp. PACM 27299]ALL05128.1 hypothetical protein AQ505_06245 [Pedobacter sp. PACM 27299]
MKILITGGKSASALKLLKAFANQPILLADYGDMPAFSSAAYQMHSLGTRNDDTTAHTLLNNCLDENVEMLLPIHDFEIEAVAKSMVLFEEFGIEVLLPQPADLPKYLSTEKQSGDWALYQKGILLFPENANEAQKKLGIKEKLNGVFYTIDSPEGLKPVLFTINS